MFGLRTYGEFRKTVKWLQNAAKPPPMKTLNEIGTEGVKALQEATPYFTGLASESWGYEVHIDRLTCTVTWTNTDIENGFPVILALQYGYVTGTGGFVLGEDFVNPALQPIFKKFIKQIEREVRRR